MKKARLILDDGSVFHGRIFAQGADCFGEVIFNTAMSGYQEVLTDPSYKEQIVVMTYPLIGNYGINLEDNQSKKLHLKALVIKEYCDFPSNWRSHKTLKQYLEENNIIGIEGIDTRRLTRNLRETGAKKGVISTAADSDEICTQNAQNAPNILEMNLAKEVSTPTSYKWKTPDAPKFKVAVIDCGVKTGILDQLVNAGCDVTVFPYNTPASTYLDGGFDGVHISNGPGSPDQVTETIDVIKDLVGNIPLFGICLGHQLLCLALNIEIHKLQFGHHGLNHPVKNMATGAIEITSQNHIYCTVKEGLPSTVEVSHVNQNDDTISGIRSDELKAFSVQYHPEASPGPHDSHYLFHDFTYLMQHQKFETKLNSAVSV